MRSERSSANTQGNKCGMQEGKIDPVAGISMDTLVQAVHMSGRINRLDEYRVLSSAGVTVIEGTDKGDDYDHFFNNYLVPNKPCLFTASALHSYFQPCRNDWLICGNNYAKRGRVSKPNLKLLVERYGDADVTVAHCHTQNYNDNNRITMKFREYAEYWQKMDTECDEQSMCEDEDEESLIHSFEKEFDPNREGLYLKEFGSEMAIYSVPLPFSDDWIDYYWNEEDRTGDYRFVYMGTEGTWTPFHCDVFSSYSWSTNIVGRKLWYFYPPNYEHTFRDKFDQSLRNVLDRDNTIGFPEFTKIRPITCIQEEGETIFGVQLRWTKGPELLLVPSGWWHQVHNLEATISINHNWANACNLDIIVKYLKTGLRRVEEALKDNRQGFTDSEWKEHCDLVMDADLGINIPKFMNFLRTISEREVMKLVSLDREKIEEIGLVSAWYIERQLAHYLDGHAEFDEVRQELQQAVMEVVAWVGCNNDSDEKKANAEEESERPLSSNREAYLCMYNLYVLGTVLRGFKI